MNWLINLYKTNSSFRGVVQAFEGGAITGLFIATANGLDFSKKGMTALVAAVLGGGVTALRNWYTNRPNQPAISDGQKQ